jgi:hypothetical protein
MRKKEMMQRKKVAMKELGFFPSQGALFIIEISWASAK